VHRLEREEMRCFNPRLRAGGDIDTP